MLPEVHASLASPDSRPLNHYPPAHTTMATTHPRPHPTNKSDTPFPEFPETHWGHDRPSLKLAFWLLTGLTIFAFLLLHLRRRFSSLLHPRLRRFVDACTTSHSSANQYSLLSTKPPPSEIRAPGTWTRSTFTRPDPAPYEGWDIVRTEPKPYRPFRYGPKYNITMGLRPMKWDEWIELDNQFLKFHADKARRIKERGAKCCKTADEPRVFDGAVELCEELCAYLPVRYPGLFRKTKNGMENLVTKERFDIRREELCYNGVREDPMQLAARMVQDDLAIMFEKEDGQYYLLAGAVLLAGFWRLEDKFGMVMSEIHTR